MDIKELDLLEKQAELISSKVEKMPNGLYIRCKHVTELQDNTKVLNVSRAEFLIVYFLSPLSLSAEAIYDEEWHCVTEACTDLIFTDIKNIGSRYLVSIDYHPIKHSRNNNCVVRYNLTLDDLKAIALLHSEEKGLHGTIHEFLQKCIEDNLNSDECGSVYVVERDDGLCKIGYSKQAKKRVKSIVSQSGIQEGRVYISPEVTQYPTLETRVHKRLEKRRCIGEWFDIGFTSAVQTVESVLTEDGLNEKVGIEEKIYNCYDSKNRANALFYLFKTN